MDALTFFFRFLRFFITFATITTSTTACTSTACTSTACTTPTTIFLSTNVTGSSAYVCWYTCEFETDNRWFDFVFVRHLYCKSMYIII